MLALTRDGCGWLTVTARLLVDGVFGYATVLLAQGDLLSIGSIAPAIYLVASSTCSCKASLNLLHPALVQANSWHSSCNNVAFRSWLCYGAAVACNWHQSNSGRCVLSIHSLQWLVHWKLIRKQTNNHCLATSAMGIFTAPAL
jgi:hypothetical protein